MRTFGRTRWQATAVTVMTAALLTTAPSAGARTSSTHAAAGAFAGCLAAQKHGDLLVLMDTSGSLQQTDPSGVRVQAAKYLLTQLQQTAEQLGASLDVALAGFDVNYVRTLGWVRLDQSTLPAIQTGLESFRQRDDGIDTDYVNALSGAQEELRARQRAVEPGCQALVWLSDGKFDIEARTSPDLAQQFGTQKSYAPGTDLRTLAGVAEAERAGVQSLCRGGGVVDQLRADGVLTFAVGLGGADDFRLMQSAATGDPVAGVSCGRTPTGTPGDFTLAADVDELAFALNTIVGSAPLDERSAACPKVPCRAGTRAFVLDASVGRVDVLAAVQRTGVDVILTPPSGVAPLRLSWPGTDATQALLIDGQKLSATWLSNRQLHLDLVRGDASSWAGRWSLSFVQPGAGDPGTLRTQIRLTGDLVPRWLQPAETLRAGQVSTLRFGIASSSSAKALPAGAVLGDARISAVLTAPTGAQIVVFKNAPLRSAAAGGRLDLAHFPLGGATLRLTLGIRTQGTEVAGVIEPGTQLADRHVDLPVTVLPPLHFPTAAAHIDLGRVVGLGPRRGGLPLTGPGCAWLGGSDVQTGPQGVQVTVTSSADSPTACVKLGPGEKGVLPLDVRLGKAGNGTVSGALDVRLAPAGAPERALAFRATFVVDFARPVKQPVLWAVFVLAVLMAIAVPLLLLLSAKKWAARIPGKSGIRTAMIPVTVNESDVLRAGAPLTLTPADASFRGLRPRGTRRLDIYGATLVTRAGSSPLGLPFVRVQAPPGQRVATSQGNDRLPLAVQGQWFALFPANSTASAQLVVLLPTQAGQKEYDRIAREVRERLPQLAQRLAPPGGADPASGPATAPPAAPTRWASTRKAAPTTADKAWTSTGAGEADVPRQPSPATDRWGKRITPTP
jgi:von Willebrand factor type A domain